MMESRKEWVGACWFVGIELKPGGDQLKMMRANWESWKRVWRFLCESSWRPFLVLQSISSHKLPTSHEAKSHNFFSSVHPVLVLKWLQPLRDIHICGRVSYSAVLTSQCNFDTIDLAVGLGYYNMGDSCTSTCHAFLWSCLLLSASQRDDVWVVFPSLLETRERLRTQILYNGLLSGKQ
jgi:hypothetical protein